MRTSHLLLAAGLLGIFSTSCDTKTRVVDSGLGSNPSGGNSAPNGADPKQAAMILQPQATIPWSPTNGTLSLGSGVGNLLESKQSAFDPVIQFTKSESSSEFAYTEREDNRSFSQSTSFGVSVGVSVGLYGASVAYNQANSTSGGQSFYAFEGFLRLIKERQFISSAAGHYALKGAVTSILAQAEQARAAQNWNQLQLLRDSFEAAYGIGFASQRVMGYAMSLYAAGNESWSNSAASSSLKTEIRTPWVTGSFNNENQVNAAASQAGFTLNARSRGLNTVITSVQGFYAIVAQFKQIIEGTHPNPGTLVANPDDLWVGINEYKDLPEFALLYDPIGGTLFATVDTQVVAQPIQLPVLGAVGEMVSLGSYARNPAVSVWLAPYLFPGNHSATPGTFTLDVRPFDLLKQLSRDAAFRQVGDTFLVSRGYHDEVAARPVVMPTSTGGISSPFPEYVGAFYSPNVQQIRPVLYLTQPGNPNPVRIQPDDQHWRPLGLMGLGNFGGPGASTCGLFYGANSLSFQFADSSGDIASAATAGRLRLATEVAMGVTSIELSQTKSVTGAFIAATWEPNSNYYNPTPHPSDFRAYSGTEKAVLVRWPVNWTAFNYILFPQSFGGLIRCFDWQESQDNQWTAPGGFYYPGHLGGPVMHVVHTLNPVFPYFGSTFWPAYGENQGVLAPAQFGNADYMAAIYGNNGSPANIGSYQSILVLGQ